MLLRGRRKSSPAVGRVLPVGPTKLQNHAPDRNYDQISSRPLMKVILEFLSKRQKPCYPQAYSPDHILWYGAAPSLLGVRLKEKYFKIAFVTMCWFSLLPFNNLFTQRPFQLPLRSRDPPNPTGTTWLMRMSFGHTSDKTISLDFSSLKLTDINSQSK